MNKMEDKINLLIKEFPIYLKKNIKIREIKL